MSSESSRREAVCNAAIRNTSADSFSCSGIGDMTQDTIPPRTDFCTSPWTDFCTAGRVAAQTAALKRSRRQSFLRNVSFHLFMHHPLRRGEDTSSFFENWFRGWCDILCHLLRYPVVCPNEAIFKLALPPLRCIPPQESTIQLAAVFLNRSPTNLCR